MLLENKRDGPLRAQILPNGVRAIGLGNHPHFVASSCDIGAEKTKALFQTELVFFAILAELTRDMARKQVHHVLSGFVESDQRSGCSDELAQIKQRFSFGLLQENFLLLNFGFYFAGIAERCNEKQMPVAAGKGACPSLRQGCRGVAFTGAKRRPLTKEADDQAQVWPGRTEAVLWRCRSIEQRRFLKR